MAIFPVLLHGPCCKVGRREVPRPTIASLKSNRLPPAIRRRLQKPSFAWRSPSPGQDTLSGPTARCNTSVAVPPCATDHHDTMMIRYVREAALREKTLRATPLLRNDGASYFQEWNLRSIYRANDF